MPVMSPTDIVGVIASILVPAFLIVVVCSFNDLQKKPYYLSERSFKILRKAPTAQTQLKRPVRWYLNTFNVSIRGTAV